MSVRGLMEHIFFTMTVAVLVIVDDFWVRAFLGAVILFAWGSRDAHTIEK